MKRCRYVAGIKWFDIFEANRVVKNLENRHRNCKCDQYALKQVVFNNIYFSVRHHGIGHITQNKYLLILCQQWRCLLQEHIHFDGPDIHHGGSLKPFKLANHYL